MGWVEELPSGRFRGVARNPLTGKKWSKAHDRWSQADAWWRAEERDADGDYTAAGLAYLSPRQYVSPAPSESVQVAARPGVPSQSRRRVGF